MITPYDTLQLLAMTLLKNHDWNNLPFSIRNQVMTVLDEYMAREDQDAIFLAHREDIESLNPVIRNALASETTTRKRTVSIRIVSRLLNSLKYYATGSNQL